MCIILSYSGTVIFTFNKSVSCVCITIRFDEFTYQSKLLCPTQTAQLWEKQYEFIPSHTTNYLLCPHQLTSVESSWSKEALSISVHLILTCRNVYFMWGLTLKLQLSAAELVRNCVSLKLRPFAPVAPGTLQTHWNSQATNQACQDILCTLLSTCHLWGSKFAQVNFDKYSLLKGKKWSVEGWALHISEKVWFLQLLKHYQYFQNSPGLQKYIFTANKLTFSLQLNKPFLFQFWIE